MSSSLIRIDDLRVMPHRAKYTGRLCKKPKIQKEDRGYLTIDPQDPSEPDIRCYECGAPVKLTPSDEPGLQVMVKAAIRRYRDQQRRAKK